MSYELLTSGETQKHTYVRITHHKVDDTRVLWLISQKSVNGTGELTVLRVTLVLTVRNDELSHASNLNLD